MTGFNFTRRVGRARNLTAAEVDANFQAASDAVAAIVTTGGGASTYATLTDAFTVDLVSVNTPLNTALAAKATVAQVNALTKANVGLPLADNTADASKPVSLAQQTAIDAKVQSGATITTSGTTAPNATAVNTALATKAGLTAIFTPYSTVIPLDTAGPGKAMTQTSLVANSVFTVGSNPTPDGSCQLVLVGDGSHTPDLSAFQNLNGYTYTVTNGTANYYVFGYQYSKAVFVGALFGTLDITAPTLVSAAVPDSGGGTRIDLTWSEPMNSAISAAAAFAISSVHTISAHTTVDSSHSYLTVTPAFVGTESAKTLSYTQPGSNKMQDLAGNLIANFSGTAITNNVTTPTLVSAVVANGAPSNIVLTWSEPINSTVPAPSTFSVNSGHPLTFHTYFSSTVSYLVTSTPFVAGETKTLSYTPSGTNDLQDVNGNKAASFSGTSITDNVGAGATLTQSSQTIGTTLDLNAGGYRDYYLQRKATGQPLQKTGQPLISHPITETNVSKQPAGGTWPTLTATDWVNAESGGAVGTFSAADADLFYPTAAGAWGVSWTIPATTSSQTVRVHFGGKRDDGFACPGRCKLTATLSDGSAGPLTITTAAPSGDGVTVAERHDIVFTAGTSTTLTLTFEAAAGNTTSDFIVVQAIILV